MRRSDKLLFIFALVVLNPLTVQAVLADWSPEAPSAFYSRLDRPVYVQIVYGSMANQPVFVPFDVNTITKDSFYIIMGGLSDDDLKIAHLDVHGYNATSRLYDTAVDHRYSNITLSLNSSTNDFFAVKRIELNLNATGKVLCIFRYKDIRAEFYYMPDPLYRLVETNQTWFFAFGVITIFLTVIVLTVAYRSGGKFQQKAVLVPAVNILVGLLLAALLIVLAISLIFVMYPKTGIDLAAHFLLDGKLYFILFPALLCSFTPYFGHGFSDKFLRTLQVDLSQFEIVERVPLEPVKVKEGEEVVELDEVTKKRVRWIKDFNFYYCYERDGELCVISNPGSWLDTFRRFFGFHTRLIGHEHSMQPDAGYWLSNNKRVFVSCYGIEAYSGSFEFHWNLTLGPVLIFVLASALVPVAFLQPYGVLVTIALLLISVGLFTVPLFIRHGLFYIVRVPGYWDISANRFRESEQILYSTIDFLRLRNHINKLEAEYYDAIASKDVDVTIRTKGIADAIERALWIGAFYVKHGRKPTDKELEKRASEGSAAV